VIALRVELIATDGKEQKRSFGSLLRQMEFIQVFVLKIEISILHIISFQWKRVP